MSDDPARQRADMLTRPVIGHDVIRDKLVQALSAGRLHHALLLSGPTGIGKATLAWSLAADLLAEGDDRENVIRQMGASAHPDLAILEGEGNGPGFAGTKTIPVDRVREVIRRLGHSSGRGRRVAIIDAVDQLNMNAANALLKSLEEPPEGVVWIMVAHVPGRLPATIRSRAVHYRLGRLTDDDVASVVEAHGLAPDPALVGLADGRPGRAVALAEVGEGDDVALFRAVLAGEKAPEAQALRGLAERLGRRSNDAAYAAIVETWFTALHERLMAQVAAGAPPAALAELSELWNNSTASIRDTDVFNLDRIRLIDKLLSERPTERAS